MQSPIGSNPALRTSRNSLTEKSEVKIPSGCPSPRSPFSRSSACFGICPSAVVTSDSPFLVVIYWVGVVPTRHVFVQRRPAIAQIDDRADRARHFIPAPALDGGADGDEKPQIVGERLFPFPVQQLLEPGMRQHAVAHSSPVLGQGLHRELAGLLPLAAEPVERLGLPRRRRQLVAIDLAIDPA